MGIPTLKIRDKDGNVVSVPAIKGDKGDKGDQGEQGIQGIQGIQGDKGDKGDPYNLTDADKKEIADMVELPLTIEKTYKTSTDTDTKAYYVEKHSDGVVKAKGKYKFSSAVFAPYGSSYHSAMQYVSLKDIFGDIVDEIKNIFDISVHINNTNQMLGVNLVSYEDSKNPGKVSFYVFSHLELTEATAATLTFELIGKWK